MGPGPNDGGLSRHHIVRACEASLRRLDTDHIDLYQVHEWDGLTPLEETLSALDALVQSGKVRYIGSSNYTGWQLMKALWISDRHGLESFVSQQIYYSLQARDAENELVPIAIDQRLGILVWSPLAGGLLSGKYRRGQEAPEGTRRFEGWTEPPVHDEDRLYDTVDALVEIGEEHGVSAAQVALAYTAGPARGDVGHRRRPHRGAAARQPGLRRALAERGRAGAPEGGQRRPAALSRTGTRPTRDLAASARRTSACWPRTCPETSGALAGVLDPRHSERVLAACDLSCRIAMNDHTLGHTHHDATA